MRKIKAPLRIRHDPYTKEPYLEIRKKITTQIKELLVGPNKKSIPNNIKLKLKYKENKNFSLYIPLPEHINPQIGENMLKADVDEETKQQLIDIFKPNKDIIELCKMSLYEQMRVNF